MLLIRVISMRRIVQLEWTLDLFKANILLQDKKDVAQGKLISKPIKVDAIRCHNLIIAMLVHTIRIKLIIKINQDSLETK